MDRLSVAILVSLFLFSGSGLASATFLAYIFFGVASIDHVTLFSLCSLLTYNFYGLLGMFYVLMCSLTLIACGLMYWYEMSVDDLKKKASEMQTQVGDKNSDGSQTGAIDERLKVANDYKNNLLGTFWLKTGLTEERRAKYWEHYLTASNKFDTFYVFATAYASQFRDLTKDIPVLKTLYYAYDQFFVYKQSIESVRALHKLSRNLTMPPSQPQTRGASSNVSVDSNSESSTSSAPPVDLGAMFGGLNMPDMEEMQKQMENMSPEEKKRMDDMTEQMMKNMNLGDMMKMFGGIEGMMGPPQKGGKKRGGRR